MVKGLMEGFRFEWIVLVWFSMLLVICLLLIGFKFKYMMVGFGVRLRVFVWRLLNGWNCLLNKILCLKSSSEFFCFELCVKVILDLVIGNMNLLME